MGGGGGDGGASARQAQTEASKAAAREKLNRQFGLFVEPDRNRFVKTVTKQIPSSGEGQTDYHTETSSVFDQGAYDAEMADFNAAKATSGDRDKLYQTVRDDAYAAGKRGLDETRDQAARKTKFELFARGLNGGSEDINQNALLGRTYSQGLMDLGSKADAAKTQFKTDDEQTRLSLLQSIDAGMDQGSASSSAMSQMKNSAERAAATAQGTSLGDLFANSRLIYNQSQAAKGKADGTAWWNTYGPSRSRLGGSNPNGDITGTS